MDGLSVSNGGAPAVDTISVAEKSLLQKVSCEETQRQDHKLLSRLSGRAWWKTRMIWRSRGRTQIVPSIRWKVLRSSTCSPTCSRVSMQWASMLPQKSRYSSKCVAIPIIQIQETALPTLLADPPQNMIAQSQSGTGKTAAFVLAMLSRVNTDLKHPQVGPFHGVLSTTALSGTLPVPYLWASLANWWGRWQDVPLLPRPHHKVNKCRKEIQYHLCHAQVCCERWRSCQRIQNHWQHHHRHSWEGKEDTFEWLLYVAVINCRCLTGVSSSGSLIWAR